MEGGVGFKCAKIFEFPMRFYCQFNATLCVKTNISALLFECEAHLLCEFINHHLVHVGFGYFQFNMEKKTQQQNLKNKLIVKI